MNTPLRMAPDVAQATFRAVMEALARPGVVSELPQAELPQAGLPPVLLPLHALADYGTGACVIGDDGSCADALRIATDAPAVALDEARLVAALQSITVTQLRSLHRGTAETPEAGALAAVPVQSLDGGVPLLVSGPGVREQRRVAPTGLPDGFAAARAEAVAGFPAGIDLLLIDPGGRTVGLPRTTVVSEEES